MHHDNPHDCSFASLISSCLLGAALAAAPNIAFLRGKLLLARCDLKLADNGLAHHVSFHNFSWRISCPRLIYNVGHLHGFICSNVGVPRAKLDHPTTRGKLFPVGWSISLRYSARRACNKGNGGYSQTCRQCGSAIDMFHDPLPLICLSKIQAARIPNLPEPSVKSN